MYLNKLNNCNNSSLFEMYHKTVSIDNLSIDVTEDKFV